MTLFFDPCVNHNVKTKIHKTREPFLDNGLPLTTIIRAQQGNPEDIGTLYTYYHQSIFRYLYYRTGDLRVAEDLTGEVFLKMVQVLPSIHFETTPLAAWLFLVARNISIDYFRRINAHIELAMDEAMDGEDPDLDGVVEDRMNSESLAKAVSSLDDLQRDVILLRFIENMPIHYVAMVLHKSQDSVKSLQRRGLLALRKLFARVEVDRD